DRVENRHLADRSTALVIRHCCPGPFGWRLDSIPGCPAHLPAHRPELPDRDRGLESDAVTQGLGESERRAVRLATSGFPRPQAQVAGARATSGGQAWEPVPPFWPVRVEAA